MMYANYHSHTFRCHHASGTEREYIEEAIKSGIRILGFSDHSPYIFNRGDYYSNYRMRPEETEDYVRVLSDLRDEYKNDIEIHIGLEIEYYPLYFRQTMDFLSQFPIEYYILGQHNLASETEMPLSWPGHPSPDPAKFDLYINEIEEGLSKYNFLYLAHPDLMNFTGDAETYKEKCTRLCDLAKKADIPVEINLLGIRAKRNYPNEIFWKIAGEKNLRTVIGIDAHDVESISNEAAYRQALDIAVRNGLKIEETLEIK